MRATIKLGDTGEDVKRLQRVFARNKVLGPDDVDGVFGPQTAEAVKDFQQSNALAADGVVGPITWSHVHPYREASPTLQTGSLGRVVAMLQGVLKIGFGYTGAGSASLYVHMAVSNGSIRARSSSIPARPYMARLSALRRLICPSAWPLLQCSTMAFLTASISRLNVRANCCIRRTPECFAS